MKQNYELEGMGCGGCVNSVKKALLQMSGVDEAEIYLHPQAAVLTMSKPINLKDLQAQLSKAGHYKIKEVVSNSLK